MSSYAEFALRKLWERVSSEPSSPDPEVRQTDNLERTKIKQLGGAPRQWDWDGALLYLAARAHDSTDGLLRADGKEPTASDIAKMLSEWFISQTDNSPADSALRQYGSRFLEALDTIKRRSANN